MGSTCDVVTMASCSSGSDGEELEFAGRVVQEMCGRLFRMYRACASKVVSFLDGIIISVGLGELVKSSTLLETM